MSNNIDEPTFNLKAVVQETGIKPHTLRAWERRYGLPTPDRSSGGHRLYSQQEIETVKWLIARQEEGLTIGRAVELWFSLKEKKENPLVMAEYQMENPWMSSLERTTPLELRKQWIDFCLRFDEVGAERVLIQAFSLYPVETVCIEIMQKGLSDVGDLWYQNKATVQQEHFTSSLILRRLDALLLAAPPPNNNGRILISCPPQEQHTIPLLLLSLLLRYRGWEVVFLHANVPLNQLESTIDSIKPSLVIMNAQRLHTAAMLRKAALLLNKKGVMLGFGGLIFDLVPDLYQRIPGHFLGNTIVGAVPNVTKIMSFSSAPLQTTPIPEAYEKALAVYNKMRAQIEFETRKITAEIVNIPYDVLEATHARMSESIMAGLHLGDLSFINAEIELERQLITNYDISFEWQVGYFDTYFQMADRYLNGRGRPIVEWLDKIRSNLKVR